MEEFVKALKEKFCDFFEIPYKVASYICYTDEAVQEVIKKELAKGREDWDLVWYKGSGYYRVVFYSRDRG